VSDAYVHSVALMGTVVTIQVVGHNANRQERIEREEGVERAVRWFNTINDDFSRFDSRSEVSRLSATVGTPIPVSSMLFEAVRFALAVAEQSGGAFDPTVGRQMMALGFDQDYRSGMAVGDGRGSRADRGIARVDRTDGDCASYRDVILDAEAGTITLHRPLTLDLGAVAKGLAVDLAALELRPFRNFAVDAGGDIYFSGHNLDGEPWSVGIRHPREENELIHTLRVSDMAVCTSGDYERTSPSGDGSHHIIDPRSTTSPTAVASVTVLAPSAMIADALATAAFVLGPADGIALLEQNGVDGLIVTPSLERFTTSRHHQDDQT